jgi:UrcA family protein
MKVSILLVACVLGASQAYAADTDDVRTVKVFVADLNQNSEAGIAELYKRVKSAASFVCERSDGMDKIKLAYDKCRQAAIERAVAGIPALAKYDPHKHKIKNG